jgi:glucokinase
MGTAALGIDIGGTKLAAGIVDAGGTILARGEVPTLAAEGPERVLERTIRLAEDLLGRSGVSGDTIQRIGIGCAGPVDRQAGLKLNPPNLPGWTRVPLVAMQSVPILPAALGRDAGILGAAAVALDS